MLKADLHIHTSYSDGKMKPDEIIDLANEKGLKVIGVTDHDNIEGSQAMLELNGKHGIEVIPGIELSADFHGKEVHLLGYFMDFKNPALIEHLKLIKNLRIRRIDKMIVKLKELGVNINSTALFEKYSSSCSIGRPHLANEILEQGYVKDFQTAFNRYLGDNKPAFVKKDNLNFEIMIELIKVSGGLSFVAHPGSYFRESTLVELKKAGIRGIEVYHPSHNDAHNKKYMKFVKEHNLLAVGGSDFHGYSEYDYHNIGRFYIDEAEFTLLKEKAKSIRNQK
ncbi:MAG: PHP domain-containing protein [Ignavibacteriae bacterium]|nr:PHP domain-containing protein [Ignavibacteriota bacterium]